ncbi:MAG: hypothetical protein J6U89_03605, partial [Bacteroidaceae bacterium]|nr:hypothetical protein [Bacteroidaceae bacterium]
VSQNKALTSLNCNDNKLTSLDVTQLFSLTELSCGGNDIPTLNVTKNTLLTALDCDGNNLTLLDLTKNSELEKLYSKENNITAIYIGSNKLKTIDCANNALTGLNLSLQTNLEHLDCSHNALSLLDITKCGKLNTVDCSYNALTSLNISKNNALTSLDCSGNNKLAKVLVKDEAQANNITITKESTTSIFYNNGGVNFPDAALKAYLINNYDDDGDGEISKAESDNITMINCSGKGVSDLTGLEACTNIVTLNCANNNITTIELPNLTKLRNLTCNNNPILHINIDNCTVLEHLNLQGTPSNAISGTAITINNYTQSETLYFSAKYTPFTSFTVKNTPALTSLEFYGEFTDVTVTDNTALTSLVFHSPAVNATLSGNSILESVNVSALTDLQTLDVQKCNLQSLNVSNNKVLASLDCSDNAFSTLDLTQNTQLQTLIGNNLALTKINLSNNPKLSKYSFTCNPELIHIRVHNDFTMDNCLFTSAGNNPNLSIFNTVGNIFYYIGQFSTAFGSAGVVYETKNGGQNGKMISTEETVCSWGLYGTRTYAGDGNDGSHNVQIMKEGGYYESSPLYVWCGNYGTDWYPPGIYEMQAIYDNKSTINSALSANGCTTISNSYYWSSTENNDDAFAYCRDMSNGRMSYSNRNNNVKARAIHTF